MTDLLYLRTFQRQILSQCKCLISSKIEIDKRSSEGKIEETFFSIQSFLVSFANIYKLLYGSGCRKSEEREVLRYSLGLENDTMFRGAQMRNNFEHIDERIDEWWRSSDNHLMIDLNFSSRDQINGAFGKENWFRNYDPKTTIVTFWGDDFCINEIYEYVISILPRIEAEVGKPHW